MSRSTILWTLFVLQALCCTYFLLDVVWEILWPARINQFAENDVVELLMTLALVLSLSFTANELRQLLRRHDQLEDQIKVASGAFSDVMESRFRAWALTDAERDVAILAIKGFSVAEMAGLRATKQGTVKAQCASVYRKAGVAGRLQLLSLFLDELLEEDLVQNAGRATA